MVTVMSLGQTVELIAKPFGVLTCVGARNRVLDGVHMAPPGKYGAL